MSSEKQLSSLLAQLTDVLRSAPASAATRMFLIKLMQLDLGAIAHTLYHKKKWQWQKILQAIVKYLAFLLLIYLYPDQKLVPCEEIDAVWHCHILDTLKYTEDCQNLFGYYVHHFPYLGERGEEDEHDLQRSFAETERLFSQALTMMKDTTQQAQADQSCPPKASGCCLRQSNMKLVRPGTALTLEMLKDDSVG
ncbi:glycine-rich domain-containing protein-like [Leptolyngbyaceae cyanobacterium UHCC 1019]